MTDRRRALLTFLRNEKGDIPVCDIWLDTEPDPCDRAAVARVIIDDEPVNVCRDHFCELTRLEEEA